MIVICDTETNAIINPDKLWIIACKEVDSGKIHTFLNLHEDENERRRFNTFANKVSYWIGHNFIGFDCNIIFHFLQYKINPSNIIDTLVVSRLLNEGIAGGHSLEAIGERLGCPKGNFSDFSHLSDEMIKYCHQDLEVTYKYYKSIEKYLHSNQWKSALRTEHDIAFICKDMHENGFGFNQPEAIKLHKEIVDKIQVLDQEILKAFPPKAKFIKEITPRVTAKGNLHRGDFRWLEVCDLTSFSEGATFSRIEFESFNPGSSKQIVERLNEAGWSPTEKTKGHIQAERESNLERLEYFKIYGWKISEKNLSTLSETAPKEAKTLVQRILLDSRRSTLEEWINACEPDNQFIRELPNNSQSIRSLDSKKEYQKSLSEIIQRKSQSVDNNLDLPLEQYSIHGNITGIGCWTHRMSHSGPNVANIPAAPSLYHHEMRSMWQARKGRLLIGVDAESIQLRILAHYMNDERFTKAVVSGKKEDGTDPHNMNKKALGEVCKSRVDAKTFIYAWLLGAMSTRVSQILKCSIPEAKIASNNFIKFYPGLEHLKKNVIPHDARRGYFEGFDGRLVICDSEHLMLAGYLQNGESTIMKRANIKWRNQLDKERIPYWQVNFVHDEWQTETIDDMDLAIHIAQIQANAIKEVGEELNLRCPFAGSFTNDEGGYTIGYNWSMTH